MTQHDWYSSQDPFAMMEYLQNNADRDCRRNRLFCCAICRNVWNKITDENCRKLIEKCELVADNEIPCKTIITVSGIDEKWSEKQAGYLQCQLVFHCSFPDYFDQWSPVMELAQGNFVARARDHAAIVREIFGNPYNKVERYSKEVDSKSGTRRWINEPWLDSPNVIGIARNAYNEPNSISILVLADALEDAGCTDESILRHCRGYSPCDNCGGTGKVRYGHGDAISSHERGCVCGYGGPDCGWMKSITPHYKGCWVLDLILDKE